MRNLGLALLLVLIPLKNSWARNDFQMKFDEWYQGNYIDEDPEKNNFFGICKLKIQQKNQKESLSYRVSIEWYNTVDIGSEDTDNSPSLYQNSRKKVKNENIGWTLSQVKEETLNSIIYRYDDNAKARSIMVKVVENRYLDIVWQTAQESKECFVPLYLSSYY